MTAREDFEHIQTRLLGRVGLRAESRYIDVASVTGRVHVLVAGEGPPIVLVPGFGDPAVIWAPLMARLMPLLRSQLGGATLYAVDRPCAGLSGSAQHTTATFRSLATNFLEQVLDALGLERPAFVANSMGSLWSIWLALDRPHRVGPMAHVGCPALILGTSAPIPMRLLSVPGLGRLLMSLFPPSTKQVDQFAAMAGADLSSLPELREALVAMQRMPGVPRALRELLHAALRLRGARPEVALGPSELGRISQPILLLWGDRDPFGSLAVAKQVAEIIPDAALHVLPGGGHVPWIDAPGLVSEHLATFLGERWARRHSETHAEPLAYTKAQR